MRTTLSLIACVMVVATAATVPARAGSIWAKSTLRTRSFYTDFTARNIGDPLTIVIAEKSTIQNQTNRSMDKSTSQESSLGGDYDIVDAINKFTGKLFSLRTPNLDFKADAANKFDGKATYGSNRSVDDEITVVVEDILPNGNLVVLGKRQRMVDGDLQIVEISGIVRPSDISFDNKVNSQKVADFHFVYTNKGRENRFTKPGWLNRILNLLNPF